MTDDQRPEPGRKPYRETLRTLRQEVGFCCPVEGCGSPYLTWHHFDPPWRVEKHHRPEGMIALCRIHADQADNGAFADEQLRELKHVGKARGLEVRGKFNWMRQDLLAVVGGNFYYETPVVFQIGTEKCIWFERDENRYLLLNFRIPTLTGQPRAEILQNFWTIPPAVSEIICPPNGRVVEVFYPNGDRFKAEFFNVASQAELDERYPESRTHDWSDKLTFPLTAVELWETAEGTSIEFGPNFSHIGSIQMRDCFSMNSHIGVHVGATEDQIAQLFPKKSAY